MSDGPSTQQAIQGTPKAIEFLDQQRRILDQQLTSAESDIANNRLYLQQREADAARYAGEIEELERAVAVLSAL